PSIPPRTTPALNQRSLPVSDATAAPIPNPIVLLIGMCIIARGQFCNQSADCSLRIRDNRKNPTHMRVDSSLKPKNTQCAGEEWTVTNGLLSDKMRCCSRHGAVSFQEHL